MENKYVLNLKDYIDARETALVGREHGERLLDMLKRKEILLRKIEREYNTIEIVIPKHIASINKSYFLGLFETRIQELGPLLFKEKYSFVATEFILKKIDKNIDAALLSSSQLQILGLGEQQDE